MKNKNTNCNVERIEFYSVTFDTKRWKCQITIYIKFNGFEYVPNANSINEKLQPGYAIGHNILFLPFRCAWSYSRIKLCSNDNTLDFGNVNMVRTNASTIFDPLLLKYCVLSHRARKMHCLPLYPMLWVYRKNDFVKCFYIEWRERGKL